MRLYADGYLHALRKTAVCEPHIQRRLEELVDRWIMDPSSFIGPGDDMSTLYETGRNSAYPPLLRPAPPPAFRAARRSCTSQSGCRIRP